jgi:spore cortex formation protein SpoVR/YcgB (stage V sporulation)
MNVPDELKIILDRIANHQQSEADITVLRQWLSSDSQIVTQTGKYAVNLEQGQDIHVGDRIYQGVDAEAIREIIESLLQELNPTLKPY